jgi:peptidoglycan/LPS O-acetylase OafA/YrhL
MPVDPPRLPGRVPELDGLRGAAILLVLVWHYAVSPSSPAPGTLGAYLKQALSLSWSGVDLFFVLSGFLIGGILMEHRDSPRYWSTFFVRRACRILPPYAVVVASSVAAVLVAMKGLPAIAWTLEGSVPLWSYVIFVQNFVMAQQSTFGSEWLSVTWSLAIEEQFYLFLPLLVRLAPRKALPFLLIPLVLIAPIARLLLLMLHPHGSMASYVLLPARADALLLGVLAAWALKHAGARRVLARHTRTLYAALVPLVVGAAFLASRGPGIGPDMAAWTMTLVGLSWLAVLYVAILLLVLLHPSGPIGWLARLSWLRALGTISYGVYLFHQIILALSHTLLLGQEPTIASIRDLLPTLLALTLTLGLATLSWRAMERPIVHWGRAHRY